jgi:hypothetical protein
VREAVKEVKIGPLGLVGILVFIVKGIKSHELQQ